MATKQPARKHSGNTDRCDLCGTRVGAGLRTRWQHLRAEHPNYAHGLLLRLLAPLAFVLIVVALSALHAPAALMIGALGACLLLMGFGTLHTGSAKRAAGSPSTLKLPALFRGGGFRFVLLGVVFGLLMFATHH